MIYEKLTCLTVDAEKLRRHFLEHVAKLPPMMQSQSFGGWSIQSTNGYYTDGWQRGIPPEAASEYVKPTRVNFGYLREVMDRIDALGLEPRRARISVLKANRQSRLHRDAADDVYAVRLHIPLITDESCTFEAGGEAAHLPADGSVYILLVNRMHQIFNRWGHDRFHIIMDVRDHKGVTQHHRFIPETKSLAVETV